MRCPANNNYSMTIDGLAAHGPSILAVINPATEACIAEVPDASREQLDQAVEAAQRAFPHWSVQPIEVRQEALRQIAALLVDNAPALGELLMREQGRPLAGAVEEIHGAAHWCAEFAKQSLPVETLEDSETDLVQLQHVPLGVVGAIVPWNFPVMLAMWKVAPALLAGNTMVLKPSPFTPLTTLRIGELLRDILPPGVLNVISGGEALGPWMSEHPGIDKLSFTGSTPTGRKVMASAAPTLKRLTMELGGNDAAIVMPDVDVQQVAPLLFWGAFYSNAQICIAIKRLYIHEAIYEPLVQALVTLAQQVKIGPGDEEGVQIGPVQNHLQFQRLQDLLEDTRRNGYRILCGGEVPEGKGYFLPLTLVDNPPEDSRVVREEAFGPILPLLRFSSVDEVIARANDSEYGLGGSVWSQDIDEAQRIARRLRSGLVWINDVLRCAPNKPLAGHKQSGVGVENGLAGLLEYTVPQTVSLNKLNSRVTP